VVAHAYWRGAVTGILGVQCTIMATAAIGILALRCSRASKVVVGTVDAEEKRQKSRRQRRKGASRLPDDAEEQDADPGEWNVEVVDGGAADCGVEETDGSMFKRVRRVHCANADSTKTFWDGNTLVVVEM